MFLIYKKRDKKITIAGLISLALLLISYVCVAEEKSYCEEVSLEEAIAEIEEMVGGLKIANYRADLPSMEKYVEGSCKENLDGIEELIKDCPDEIYPLICGYSCHIELARYYYLRSGDVVLLSEKDDAEDSIGTDELLSYADRGMRRLKKGVKFINYFVEVSDNDANGDGQSANAQEERQERTLTDLIKRKATLNRWLIKLYLNYGDIWYKSVANAQVAQLNSILVSTENDAIVESNAAESNASYKMAWTFYEKARWAVLEGKTDLVGQEMEDLKNQFNQLEYEVARRIDSISNGYLYLGVDPMSFPKQDFDIIYENLKQAMQEIENIEGHVNSVIQTWNGEDKSQNMMQVDEQRYLGSKKIDLVAHSMSALHDKAKVMELDLNDSLSDLKNSTNTFSYRTGLMETAFELEKNTREFFHQKSVLETRRDIDMLLISTEKVSAQRDEIRWMINMEQSLANINLQLFSLKEIGTEYYLRIDKNEDNIAMLDNQISQYKDNLIPIEQSKIESAELEKDRIGKIQKDIYAFDKSELVEKMCSIERQLNFIGDTADKPYQGIPEEDNGEIDRCEYTDVSYTKQDFLDTICGPDSQSGIRQKIVAQNALGEAYVFVCLLGGSRSAIPSEIDLPADLCDGPLKQNGFLGSDEVDFIKQISDYERLSLEKTEEQIQNALNRIETYINDFINRIEYFKSAIDDQLEKKALKGAAYAAAAMIPKETMTFWGPEIEFDPTAPLKAYFELQKELSEHAVRMQEINMNKNNTVQQLRNEALNLKDQLNKVKNADKPLQQLKGQLALFQILGKKGELQKGMKKFANQHRLTVSECQNDSNELESRIDLLKSEHRNLTISLKSLKSKNDLYQYDISQQDKIIERATQQIAAYSSTIKNFKIQQETLEKENAVIEKTLMTLVDDRRGELYGLKDEITKLMDESIKLSYVIRELTERRENHMSWLSDKEIENLREVYESDADFYNERRLELQNQIDDVIKQQQLQDDFNNALRMIYSELDSKRQQLQDMVTKELTEGDQRTRIFSMSQEKLAGLLKGLPEYLSAKRYYLNYANHYMQKLRGRFAALMSLNNGKWKKTFNEDFVYLNSASDLKDALMNYDFLRDNADMDVHIDTVRFYIPGYSALVQNLIQDGKVTFRIDPSVTESEMEKSGYLNLWSEQKFGKNANVRVIDVIVGAQYTDPSTQDNRIVVTHLGDGVLYSPITENSNEFSHHLAYQSPRSRDLYIYDMATDKEAFDAAYRKWSRLDTSLFNFPPAEFPRSERELPFLGMPVTGTWELDLRPASATPNSELQIVFIIASSE